MPASAKPREEPNRVGRNSPPGAGRCFHAMRAAPQKVRSGVGTAVAVVARAARAAATRVATWRAENPGGEARAASKRDPSRASSIQRNRLRQRPADAPRIGHGFVRRRTSSGASTRSPKSASARPIAGAEKCFRGATPSGSTVITARHSRHRKRRTTSATISGTPAGVAGPRCCRRRFPCPWIRSPRPGARAATLHLAHCGGRPRSTDGGSRSSIQDLTKRALWKIGEVLWSSLNGTGADGARCY